jgi:nicotinate-nucleotide adenylyltransferase
MDKSETKKIVIFGGSFDPVHKGHVRIVKKLCERFDRVYVVPAFISPFKTGVKASGADVRLKMLAGEFKKLPNAVVSDFEVRAGGVSYSIDTARHFAGALDAEFGKNNYALYFAVGTEMLGGLNGWRDFGSLKKAVRFYAVKRTGFRADKTLLNALADSGVGIEPSDFSVRDFSSTAARLSAVTGRNDAVSKNTLKIIESETLYPDCRAYAEALTAFNLDAERVEHTLRTVQTAAFLAKLFGESPYRAATAAILHDIGKRADGEILRQRGVKVSKEIYDLPAPVRHAPISACIAEQYLGIADREILDAISLHTTGGENMTRLAKIIFLADFTEKGRDAEYGENVKELRRVRRLTRRSLDIGLEAALELTLKRLAETGKQICPATAQAHEYYRGVNLSNKKTFVRKDEAQSVKAGETQSLKSAAVREKPLTVSARERASGVAPLRTSATKEARALALLIAGFLDDKKAKDIILIDIADKTIIADYFVIASAGSTTAVRALTEYVDEKLSKEHALEPLRRDVDPKWAAIDYGSVILHIQCDDTRKFYDLERLWSDGLNVERV